MYKYILALIATLLFTLSTYAASITVKIYGTDDKHQNKGTVTFADSPGGLSISPHLHDLSPGPHGFHIHQNASCLDKGLAAGGHLDPEHTNTHLGPYEKGHLGDLPVLYVNAEGETRSSLIAPRLSTEDIKGHSIMLHAGGDNYTDTPSMGGGGPRVACGVIQ